MTDIGHETTAFILSIDGVHLSHHSHVRRASPSQILLVALSSKPPA